MNPRPPNEFLRPTNHQQRGDGGRATGGPRARHHDEPSSPLPFLVRRASRQRFNCPPTQPPLGDGGPKRAEPETAYGDRRVVLARPRPSRRTPAVTTPLETREP